MAFFSKKDAKKREPDAGDKTPVDAEEDVAGGEGALTSKGESALAAIADGAPGGEAIDLDTEELPSDPVEESPSGTAPSAFGIEDAIKLMQSLPADPNMALVGRVVRVTLNAVNVRVEDILADGARREKAIQTEINALEREIVDLERQVEAKRADISTKQAAVKEISSVRERLRLADQYSSHKPPPTPAEATRSPFTRPFSRPGS
jgi:hypothetical protein